ncbi:MAG: hypothetical protein GF401_02890 [Chitinivibrionales bacterium]|nr:hypothetical protein [Chitinivibrionales bacterium]
MKKKRMKEEMKKLASAIFLLAIQASAGMKPPCGDTLPIIYSPGYNISVLGIENFHPFDTKKYTRIYRRLKKEMKLCSKQFDEPRMVTTKELQLIHSEEYLESLRRSKVVARITGIPALRFLPPFVLRGGMLKPKLRATGGTILGTELAMRYGWAINLSGGYHHAKAEKGEGFCVYAEGIIQRDNYVLMKAIEEQIPILMVLSGGYHKRSGEIIGKSIMRFLKGKEAAPKIKNKEPLNASHSAHACRHYRHEYNRHFPNGF